MQSRLPTRLHIARLAQLIDVQAAVGIEIQKAHTDFELAFRLLTAISDFCPYIDAFGLAAQYDVKRNGARVSSGKGLVGQHAHAAPGNIGNGDFFGDGVLAKQSCSSGKNFSRMNPKVGKGR